MQSYPINIQTTVKYIKDTTPSKMKDLPMKYGDNKDIIKMVFMINTMKRGALIYCEIMLLPQGTTTCSLRWYYTQE